MPSMGLLSLRVGHVRLLFVGLQLIVSIYAAELQVVELWVAEVAPQHECTGNSDQERKMIDGTGGQIGALGTRQGGVGIAAEGHEIWNAHLNGLRDGENDVFVCGHSLTMTARRDRPGIVRSHIEDEAGQKGILVVEDSEWWGHKLASPSCHPHTLCQMADSSDRENTSRALVLHVLYPILRGRSCCCGRWSCKGLHLQQT